MGSCLVASVWTEFPYDSQQTEKGTERYIDSDGWLVTVWFVWVWCVCLCAAGQVARVLGGLGLCGKPLTGVHTQPQPPNPEQAESKLRTSTNTQAQPYRGLLAQALSQSLSSGTLLLPPARPARGCHWQGFVARCLVQVLGTNAPWGGVFVRQLRWGGAALAPLSFPPIGGEGFPPF